MLKTASAIPANGRRSPSLLACAVLLLPLTVPGAATALSVGEPRVESLYGQPLRLRLPVELTSEEEQSDAGLLRARLLGLDHYESESAALPEIPLEELEIATEQSAGQRWIVVRSRRSVREPMMTLFVNVRLGPSQLTREVPVLLDFPSPRRAPAPAAAPAVAAAPLAAVATVPAPAASGTAAAPSPAAPAPATTVSTVVSTLAAEAAPSPLAPPPRRRRNAAAAVVVWPERPAGYSRLRLEERLTSLERLGPLPPPATTAATLAVEPASAPAAAALGDQAAPPAAAFEPAGVGTADGAGDGGWSWGWLLAAAVALAALVLGWRRRSRDAAVAAVPPVVLARPVSADPSASPVPEFAAFATGADAEPAMAATLPAVMPGERPMDLADPADFGFEPEPELAAAGPARDRYPNQALRERVTQLAKLVSSPSERRKLELVKAYIDVERLESAEKLLAELEEHYPVYGRPDSVDFELV